MKMKKLTALVLGLMLLVGCAALAEPAVLTVHGTGTVSMTPDLAVIGFGVSRSSKDISEAQSYVNQTLSGIIEKLRGMGVQDQDIETSDIRIYEDYDYYDSGVRMPGETAYVVENNVSVTLREIDRVGEYIDAVFEAGANSFSGISFSASDSAAERAQALALAVEDAHSRAETLAKAAGLALGDVRVMRDDWSGDYYGASVNDGLYAKAESTDAGFGNLVFTSDLQVSASVTVEYALSQVDDN